MIYKCTKCGCPYVRILAWIDPYEKEIIELASDKIGICEDCGNTKLEIVDTDLDSYEW